MKQDTQYMKKER